MANQVAEMVVRSASTGTPNVYGLPYSTWQSSIADEQTAAFNLVWALADRDLLTPESRVAVVGGGAAAMSAAAALTAHDCVVDVLCATRDVMHVQRHAAHRVEHPSVLAWPMRELTLTTRLPALEWYAAPIDHVASTLIDQFNLIRPSLANVFTETKVTAVTEVATDLVLLKTDAKLNTESTYGCVILTDEFVGERTLPNLSTPSYWLPDNLEIDRDRNDARGFLVSGTGNGGLWDVMRIAHGDFAGGAMLSTIATRLSKTKLAERIREAETLRLGPTRLEQLGELYVETARDLDGATRALLRRSLDKGADVHLVGRGPVPFNDYAAPILKLLVSHAILENRVIYEVGRIEADGDRVTIDGSPFAPKDARVILRHGFQSMLEDVLSPEDYRELRQRSALMDLSQPLWTSPYPGPPGMPAQDFGDPAFRKYRLDLAARLVRERFDAPLSLSTAGYEAHFDTVPDDLPTQLFGIPLIVSRSASGVPLTTSVRGVTASRQAEEAEEPPEVENRREPETDLKSDEAETERDDLGRSILAISLARHLHRIWRRTNDAPETAADPDHPGGAFVVHLDAPWGGGKTTFANYLAKVLNPNPRGRQPAAFLRTRYPDRDVGGIFLEDPPASGDDRRRLFSLPDSARRPWIIVNFNAWESEHCSPPWWVFFQTIRKQCFKAIRTEGTHPWCANKSPDGLDFARRHGRHAALLVREFLWRLFNPKIATLLITAVLSLTALAALLYFGTWGETATTEGEVKVGFIAKSGIGLLLLGLGSTTAIWGAAALITESVVPGTATLAERLSLGNGDPFGRFRQHFDRTMHRLKRPVMVVVDDLDRCKPEVVVDLVRGMQTLLRSPRVVFLILGDRDWIERSFESHHSSMADLDVGPEQRLGARFVEKAIQMSFILPSIEGERQADFVRRVLLGDRGGEAGVRPSMERGLASRLREIVNDRVAADPATVDAPDPLVDAVIQEFRRIDPTQSDDDFAADREQIERIVFDTLATSASSDDHFEDRITHQLESLAPFFPPNPRQIKRIVNAITIYASVMLQQRLEGESPVKLRFQLAIWVIIMTEWPRSWRTIVACPAIVECIAAVDPVKALGDLPASELPASREAIAAEMRRILDDPKLKSLIVGDQALGNAPLAVASARFLRDLTPLYSRGRSLGGTSRSIRKQQPED